MTQFCRHSNMSQLKIEAATRASGLLVKFQHGNTYMALTLAEDTLGLLETLTKKMTMSGVHEGSKRWIGQISRYQANFRPCNWSKLLSLILMISRYLVCENLRHAKLDQRQHINHSQRKAVLFGRILQADSYRIHQTEWDWKPRRSSLLWSTWVLSSEWFH